MTGPVGSQDPAPPPESTGGVGLQSISDETVLASPAELDRPDPDVDVGQGPDADPDIEDQTDWAWVEEWREENEPTPWGPGLTIAGFSLILVASAVYVLSAGLADRPIVAIAVNLLVAAGLGPALWLSRGLPVLRWIAGGAVVGVLAAWLCVFVFLV